MFIAATRFYKNLTHNRSRNIAKAILPYLKPNSRMLDFGCGNFLLGQELATHIQALHVTGVDVIRDQNLDPEAIRKNNFLEFIQIENGKLPFEDKSFDFALASSSLHHTSDPEFYVGELKRILKPGGRIVIVEEMYINLVDKIWISAQDYLLNNLKKGVPIPLEFRSLKHYTNFFTSLDLRVSSKSSIRPCFPYMHHYIFVLDKKQDP